MKRKISDIFSLMSSVYLVWLYSRFQNDSYVQHLKAFKKREDAIEFAKKYTSDCKHEQYNETSIEGNEYDAELYLFDENNYDYIGECSDREYQVKVEKSKQLRMELKIDSYFKGIRIAVDKIELI